MWDKIKAQLAKELPFVVYRKPKMQTVTAILQNSSALHFVEDYTEKGFVFAPFLATQKPILIKVDERFNLEYTVAVKSTPNKGGDDLDKARYIALVNSAKAAITDEKFKKVVLSRSIIVENKKSALAIFKAILATYSNAFCYLWYHPKIGLWLGATPEILLETKHNTLTTMSLAGTQQNIGQANVVWGAKELEEQLMVTHYINNTLNGLVDNIQQSKVETTTAGQLLHLRTRIQGDFKSENLAKIVRALHPTPAICGLPKEPALKFIMENEYHDRQYYCGYLGGLNLQDDISTALYVNLRCMQYRAGQVTIYVGGGVTNSSIPEMEWEETVNKTNTMLRVL